MIEAALRLGLEELLESERFEKYQREVATNTYSFGPGVRPGPAAGEPV